jgi:hypothetical protein
MADSVGDAPNAPNTAPTVLEKASSRRKLQTYVLTIVLVPSLFLAAAIPVVRSPLFPMQASDPFLLNIDYSFSLVHKDCEIVIFGDSTALTGIDPTTVETSTGLKTCNISQSQSILAIVGPYALDSYLKHNAAPKYLVMQFAPESLARGRNDFFWPEGLTFLIRKQSLARAIPVLVLHPIQYYNFALWAIKAKVSALYKSPPDFSATQAIFRERHGLLILPKSPQTQCVKESAYIAPTLAWVRKLREQYSVNRTRVIINVSPLPTCAPDAQRIANDTRDVTDNTPQFYPIGLFCDIDRHLTREGAERASLELGAQILAIGRQ